MDLELNWSRILKVLANGKKSNKYFSIATVDADGNPHVTPIGHVFFRKDRSGFYFDEYSEAMPKNFETNRQICLMGVNSKSTFWFRALLLGRFSSAPAVRLMGTVGDPRDATSRELRVLRNSIANTRFLKGHKMLWGNLTTVRDLNFTSFSPAKYPVMCDDLWL
jgi:uncharacterized pyridoxamine 5'-phosphate oxidase family protein